MRVKHFDHDGRVRFVTFTTHQSIPLLTNTRFCEMVVEAIDRARSCHQFRLLAYVIMPEHLPLLLLPRLESKLGPAIGAIKMRSARRIGDLLRQKDSRLLPQLTINRNGKGRFVLWKPRCHDHNCRSEESVWQKVQYCHYNPVRRGLVETPEDYEWISCRWYMGERGVPLTINYLPCPSGIPASAGASAGAPAMEGFVPKSEKKEKKPKK